MPLIAIRLVVLCCMSLLLISCQNIPISENEYSELTDFTVITLVDAPNKPYLSVPGTNGTEMMNIGAGPPVMYLVPLSILMMTASGEADARKRQQDYAEKFDQLDIDIEGIVLRSFVNTLSKHPATKVKFNTQSQNIIRLQVVSYVITVHPGFPELKATATVSVRASLTDPQGEVLWRKLAFNAIPLPIISNIKKYKLAEFLNSKPLVDSAFRDAVDIVTKKLVESLAGRPNE